MSGQIFISYRRDEASAWARLLNDRLFQKFPETKIFMDVDTIEPGVDFVEAIEKSVGSCDVLIAVIGKRWLISTDEEGGRRLDNPEDFVRIEIATALERGIRLIPVLVEGASMPRPRDLPDDLKSLARRNALEVSHNRFRTDSDQLIVAVERALAETTAERRESEPSAQPSAPVAVMTPSPVIIATPTVEEKRLASAVEKVLEKTATGRREREEKERLENLDAKPTAPVAAVTPSPPVITALSAEEKARSALERATKDHPWVNSLRMKFVPVAGTQVLFSVWDTRVEDFAMFVKSTGYDATSIAIEMPKLSESMTEGTLVKWIKKVGDTVAVGDVLAELETDKATMEMEAFDEGVLSEIYVKDGEKVEIGQKLALLIRGAYSIGKDGWKQRGWKEPGFSQGATHPVVGVNWNDAQEFCKWLTKRERSAGDLPQDREYRLPTDEEWSTAAGLKNEVGSTPEEKDGKIALYPWDIPQKRDKSWPPPSGAGNYAGEEVKNGDWPSSNWSVIEGYNDGYPRTSPVGSFDANFSGLHDMGGNVWQWCEDWYNVQAQGRVLRGASWSNGSPGDLLASCRFSIAPDFRGAYIGFRCVVAREPSR